MFCTRHRLIGSHVPESSRSQAIREANPARLRDSPAIAVKKNWPSILRNLLVRIEGHRQNHLWSLNRCA